MKPFNKEEYNKLCAEFLEIKPGYFSNELDSPRPESTPFCTYANTTYYLEKEDNPDCTPYDFLQFDSDWNWIMEVVKSINSVNVYKNNPSDTTLETIREEIRTYLGLCNKEATVKTIWEFLNWYNKQSKTINK
jgi:hypothetical protein